MRHLVAFILLAVFVTGAALTSPRHAAARQTACAAPPSGAVAWYPAEGDARNLFGAGNGIPQNGAGYAAGRVGQSFSLDGSDDYVHIPSSTALRALTVGTLELWVKFINLTPATSRVFSVSKEGTPFPNSDQWALDRRGDGSLEISLVVGGTLTVAAYTAPGTISDTNFHHVAVVADGVDPIQVYVDGVLKPVSNPGGSQFLRDRFLGHATAADTANIGAIVRDAVLAEGAKLIDELSVYNRALSQSEVQAIYNAGLAGKCGARLTAPANGAAFTSPASVPLTASVGAAATSVEFYLGESLLNTDTTAPYAYNWVNVGAGTYSLTAVATYPGGVRIPSPAVTITVQLPQGASGAPDTVWMRGGHNGNHHGKSVKPRFSPDGKIMVTGGDATVKIWRTSDDTVLRTIFPFRLNFNGDTDTIHSFALSPDGTLIAVGGDEDNARKVKVFRVSDGALVQTIIVPIPRFGQIEISPDNRHIATTHNNGNDGAMYRISDGGLVRTFPDYGSGSCAFSPDGQYLAMGSGTRNPALFRVSDGTFVRSMGDGGSLELSFSADGVYLAGTSGLGPRVFKVSDGSVVGLESNANNCCGTYVALSPDGRYFAEGRGGGNVKVWQVSSATTWPLKFQFQADATGVAFTPAGQLITHSANYNLWDVSGASPSFIRTIANSGARISSVAYSSDGQLLAAGQGAQDATHNTLRIYKADGTPHGVSFPLSAGVSIRQVLFADGNRKLVTTACSAEGQSVKGWSAVDGSLLWTTPFSPNCEDGYTLAVSPDGQTVAYGGCSYTEVKLLRVSDGTSIRSFGLVSSPGSCQTVLAFSPDGQLLATNQYEQFGFKGIRLWKVSDGTHVRDFVGTGGQLFQGGAFSPDGQLFLGGTFANNAGGEALKLWRVSDGALLRSMPGHTKRLNSVAFAPDGQTVASASWDNTLRLWRVSDGAPLETYTQETFFSGFNTGQVVYSPDGRQIAYGRLDATVVVADNPFGPPPVNDPFAGAQVIAGASGELRGRTRRATRESGEPQHGGRGTASVWYRWTAPTSGPVLFTTVGSDFDTLLGVYTGSSVGALTKVADNDDSAFRQLDGPTTASSLAFQAAAGTTYYIAVDGANASGRFRLSWYYEASISGAVALQRSQPVPSGCTPLRPCLPCSSRVTVEGGGKALSTVVAGNAPYAFPHLPRGWGYTVSARFTRCPEAAPWQPTQQSVAQLTGDAGGVNFTGTTNNYEGGNCPTCTVTYSGSVRQFDGASTYEGITLTLRGATTSGAPVVRTIGVSPNGTFTFSSITRGSYTISPAGEAYVFDPVSQPFAGDVDTIGGFFTARRRFVVSGRAADTAGAPLAGVTVTLTGPATAQAVTAADGTYSFFVTAGDYTVGAAKEGLNFTPAERAVSVTTASYKEADFTSAALTRLDAVTPRAGRSSGGQQVTLNGSFPTVSSVRLGGATASIVSQSATQVVVMTPEHAAGLVALEIVPAAGATYVAQDAFRYLSPVSFSDEPLVEGVTPLKAQHVEELRGAVDALRSAAGLAPAQWTDPSLLGVFAKEAHIAELRARLEEAAAALGFAPAQYSDPSLGADGIIKRVHIEELRQRVRSIAG